MVMWYFPMLYSSKKKKEILNNDLAVLPSHDIGNNPCLLQIKLIEYIRDMISGIL